MRLDNKILVVCLGSLGVMVISLILAFIGAYVFFAVAAIAFIVALVTGIIAGRVQLMLYHRHDLMMLSRKYTQNQILQEVIDTFERNKWQRASGPGDVNYQYTKLGGFVVGPIVSAELTENQMDESEYQLDLWVSFVPTTKNNSPAFPGQTINIKKKIQDACMKFEQ